MSTFSFIKSMSNVDSGFFSLSNEPAASVDELLVYVNAKGESLVIPSGQQLSRKVKKANGYHAVYSISNGSYVYKHKATYESEDIGQYFQIEISVKLTVQDPILYIQKNEHDVHELLEPKFKKAMRKYAKNYSIIEHKEAIHDFDEAMSQMGIHEELLEYGLKSKLNDYVIDLTPESKMFYDRMFKMKQDSILKKMEMELDSEAERERERLRIKNQQELTSEVVSAYMIDLKNEGFVIATAKLQQAVPALYELMNEIWEQEQDLVKELVQSGISLEDAKTIARERQLAFGPGQASTEVDPSPKKPKGSLSGFFKSDLDEPGEQE